MAPSASTRITLGSERLASSSRDSTVRVWSLEPGEDPQVLRGHLGSVNGVSWDLLGQELFSCGEDGAVNQWEVASGRLVRTFAGHSGPVLSLDYVPNGNRLVTGSSDTTHAWDVTSGRSTVLRARLGVTEAFDATGDQILSAARGHRLPVGLRGRFVHDELDFHREKINALAFDRGSAWSRFRRPRPALWDAETGEPLRACATTDW
jgi:WD40 repeat protein